MAVAAGSIAFVALSADNVSEGFAFVVLESIAANESIRFVEGDRAGTTITADSQLVWTNGGTALQAGTLVQISLGAVPSNAATVIGGGSITAQPTAWNMSNNANPITSSDSLFAITGTVAAPGTFVAAIIYGDTDVGTLTTGASIVNLSTSTTTPLDVASISQSIGNTAYATAAAAKAAYTNTANWVRDSGVNDGTGTNNAEWPAIGATADANAPLAGKTALSIGPNVVFGDANGVVNAGEAPATPVTISGLATGATATVTFASSGGGTLTASVGGNGTTNVNLSALADGTVTVTQMVVTSGGTPTTLTNPSPASSVRLDETAPVAPALGTVTDNAGSVTGPLAAGTRTDDTTPTVQISLAGTGAVAGDTVSLLVNGTQTGSVVLSAGDISAGTVSVTSSALTGDGAKALTATVTDAAGNTSAASPSFSVTLDQTAPVAPALGTVTDNAGSVTGPLAAGAQTDDTTPTVQVSLAGTGAAAGNTVSLLVNGVQSGSVVLSVADIGAGSVSIASATLTGDGVKALSATVTDAAGNTSAASASFSVTLDTTAPTATTGVAFTTDTGTAGDGISANAALSGTASNGQAGQTITIRDGAAVLGTATTGVGGAWSFANGGAAEGSHSYTAAVTDAAGNSGASTATVPATTVVDGLADADVTVDLLDATAGPGGASLDFTIAGLDAGSTATVTFTGSEGGSVAFAYGTGGPQTANVSGLVGDISVTVSVADAAGNVAAGGDDALIGDPVCFMAGTLIRTPAGEVPVEDLRAGDLVLTAAGEAMPVRWLGRQTVSTVFGDALRVLPIRIRAGALGENLPLRDLLVSACHAVLLDGVLVQAGALVDGVAVVREARVPAVFTYYHVELAGHALVLAEGVPAESFVDNVDRARFDNWAERAGELGETVPELDLPRAKSHRQVPAATRRRLAARAAVLLGGSAAAA